MLHITIPAEESWDEQKEEFVITQKEQTLQLEHSLVSLSKWESKWCKSFLDTKNLTTEELIDYVRCMTITQNVDPMIYRHLTPDNIDEIEQYINAPMTATTFSDEKDGKGKGKKEIITAELIYYWMIALNIPPEYQKWHLNRLITLIRVCSIKNSPSKKKNKKDIMRSNAELNAARRKMLNSKG